MTALPRDGDCPHCGHPFDVYSRERYDLITYWGEDGPKKFECAECAQDFYVNEHVSRSWTSGKTEEGARYG